MTELEKQCLHTYELLSNSRNGRKDVALIYQDQRAFGHDNPKTWHVHPFNASNTHLPWEEPSMEQIFIEMNGICDRLTEK